VLEKMNISIGICAYNEEKNIGRLLEALQKQKTARINIVEIIVVSSACRDRTDEIVKSFAANDPRVRLIQQSERKGKASAINLFLKAAARDICILSSADVIPEEETIEKMCLPFHEERVGMTGGHVIPTNDKKTFIGFLSHFRWRMSHEVSLVEPVLGELVAFRKVISDIPENTAVDESTIEWKIKSLSYGIAYVPDAIIYNKGPETLQDLIKRRRSICSGQLFLRKTTGYTASSLNLPIMVKAVFRTMDNGWRSWLWTPAAVIIEAYCRLLGAYDFHIKKRNTYVWEIAATTKTIGNGEDLKSK
jgi:cellulose synthase/poly-beta-1,6-N-acetylglucosamine synthase-like glycosyltransferase